MSETDGVCQCGHSRSLHTWEYDDLCGGPGPTHYGCSCPEFRPATPPADADDLREQVFGTVAVWHSTLPLEHLQALVDAVLALPAIRDVVDERGRLRETVTRVEALMADPAGYINRPNLRRALDGPDA